MRSVFVVEFLLTASVDPVNSSAENNQLAGGAASIGDTSEIKQQRKSSQLSLKRLSSQSMQSLNAGSSLNALKPAVESQSYTEQPIYTANEDAAASFKRRPSAIKIGNASSVQSLSVSPISPSAPTPVYDVATFLHSHPLFSSSGADQDMAFLETLSTHMHVRHVKPGDFICREGEMGRAMFFLLRGTVSVLSKDGESHYVDLHTGSLFGEIGVVMDMPRTANVVAKTKCLIAALGRDDFEVICETYPRIGDGVREQATKRYQQIMQHSPSTKSSIR